METSQLRKFASLARKSLIEQVGSRLKTVLAEGSLARRENAKAVEELEKKIEAVGREQTIEMVAYTWFNRFCALRYMDVNRYTKIGVVSPADGQFQPEILAEAKMGHIDETLPTATRERIRRLLDETEPSHDPQGEAYRLLLVAVCNDYHRLMPFMFERIADFTELLLPDDLLSGNSILAYTREALLPINCSPDHTDESVEVVGWLYQFYIADKKDDVFAALKKGKKITPENIPAATQLFTPHWIVRYLVENSLGRLWMLNHPDSRLAEQMDYYIRPEEPPESNEQGDFLRISSPEEIKICDPACGSGHMLTYAFDLLYAIYEEQGYQATDIPRLILTHNLYGIEIDQRAGALAAFALTMKAREKDRRFFTRRRSGEGRVASGETTDAALATRNSQLVTQPNICVLENIERLEPEEITAYREKVGPTYTDDLAAGVNQWEEADNFGSLIRPLVTDVSEVLELLRERQMGEDLFLAGVHQKVLKALRQADYLSPKYHVVVANPPYMGNKGMNRVMGAFVKAEYKSAKSDLMTCFMNRASELVRPNGSWGMINLPTWMFIASFEDLRNSLLSTQTIGSLLHLGRGIFGSDFGSVAFVVNSSSPTESTTGYYRRLFDKHVEVRKAEEIKDLFLDSGHGLFHCLQANLQSLPGSPIAYWASEGIIDAFETGTPLGELLDIRQGLATTDNNRFLRLWPELSANKIAFGAATDRATHNGKNWFPFNKGGSFRRWYGNQVYVVDYENDGQVLIDLVTEKYPRISDPEFVIKNRAYYFRECVSWSDVTSGGTSSSFRYVPNGSIFDVCAPSAFFPEGFDYGAILCFLNSAVCSQMVSMLNPTFHFTIGDCKKLPFKPTPNSFDVARLIEIAKCDWNSFEESWDYLGCPLLTADGHSPRLEETYTVTRNEWQNRTHELQSLEEENNRRFLSVYALEEELSATVPLDQVTLTTNPNFRYVGNKSDSELEALLLADTMREFISYAVGCMLGRYSLDVPGLVLANAGESLEDYYQIVMEKKVESGEWEVESDPTSHSSLPTSHFPPDADNVIPLLDGDWFTDDISERFKEFLKVTFGTEHYEENLTFLENSLFPANLEGKKRKTIRDYFLKEFYNHHIKLYKKRPIYWLFSSPKGTFNALIYMHRYRPDTASSVLQYLRDFRAKLTHRRDHRQAVADSGQSSQSEKTKALKEVTVLQKQLKELEDYETDTLFPLAQKRLEIDLDDGVKHNYPLFGKALKKVTGLSGK